MWGDKHWIYEEDIMFIRAATTWLHMSCNLCHDMTIFHDMGFISEIAIYHCMKKLYVIH